MGVDRWTASWTELQKSVSGVELRLAVTLIVKEHAFIDECTSEPRDLLLRTDH